MDKNELYNLARYLFVMPKGILAADESNKSSSKRLEALNIVPNEENRRRWRQLLFTAPDIEKFLTGVILYDETIRQKADDGRPFAQLLGEKGIVAGIKVDKGLVELTNFAPEQITEGLDGLSARLSEYVALGARFAKWRAVFAISDKTPSAAAMHANATMLGRYAAECQKAGLVPIVEPEVLYDGNHSLEQSQSTIIRVLQVLFEVLGAYQVDFKALILKTSMALPGKESGIPMTPTAVAQATLAALTTAVPKEVAGIVFLSGGQTPEQATTNLAAIAAAGPQAWPITFSFSRALQDPAMTMWQGRDENLRAAQDIFVHRLMLNSVARANNYSPALEQKI